MQVKIEIKQTKTLHHNLGLSLLPDKCLKLIMKRLRWKLNETDIISNEFLFNIP